MLNFDCQSETSNSAARDNQQLEPIVNWLRGLSAEEMTALREALAAHDAEKLTRSEMRFEACLYLYGGSQSW
jgi:hypothetical protein